jgi:hypothetical protein
LRHRIQQFCSWPLGAEIAGARKTHIDVNPDERNDEAGTELEVLSFREIVDS